MGIRVWGVEASPYLLKIEALLNARAISFRRLPRDGSRWENITMAWRLRRAQRQNKVLRYPQMDPLDEYPSVPFLSTDDGALHYDSSAIAHWLDDNSSPGAAPFCPQESVLGFIAQLIDEAFDEYGLYMVHHQRWVCSAADTAMGETTGAEMSRLLFPPQVRSLVRDLPRRQVRRCPYLFSVAPQDYQAQVEPQRVPPSRPGFPPTHALLQDSWQRYVDALEGLLKQQPYILGGRFTLADASAYGHLSMNLIDPTTAANLQRRAPLTYSWLLDIRDGKHRGGTGVLSLSPALQPLLDIIMTTFAPLMVQNNAAYQRALEAGEETFNEQAFDRGLALYDGELLDHPFRCVVKTFQVRVWRDLCHRWQQLGDDERQSLQDMLPHWSLFIDPHY